MKIIEPLKSLENSWSRKDVINKLKNGLEPEDIVNEFFKNNKQDIEKLISCFRPEDKKLLKHIEALSACEASLLNKLNNLNINGSLFIKEENPNKNISIKNELSNFQLRLFMMKWSNRLVVMSLITLSAIALSKQAWS